jgi:hypothetical protein
MPDPIAELVQSPRARSVIIDLAANEVAVVTGRMNGCVSVILLWNPVNGVFQNVRGHHAGGGVGNVDWTALKAGVPLNATTLVVVAYLKGETEYGLGQIRDEVAANLTGVRRMFAESPNCFVDRVSPNATVRNFDDAEYANYIVRRGRSVI